VRGNEPLPVPPFSAKDPLWISAVEKVTEYRYRFRVLNLSDEASKTRIFMMFTVAELQLFSIQFDVACLIFVRKTK
jgi:hypothetical protein